MYNKNTKNEFKKFKLEDSSDIKNYVLMYKNDFKYSKRGLSLTKINPPNSHLFFPAFALAL